MTDTILMFLITTGSAIVGAIIKTIYDSKCSKCKLGCIEIERNIAAEVELEEHKDARPAQYHNQIPYLPQQQQHHQQQQQHQHPQDNV
jgi:hypothetical protein